MSLDLSVLGEIANIGGGHAATALAELFASRVDMTPPQVASLTLVEAAAALNTDDEEVTAALLELQGELGGLVVFITRDHKSILDHLGVPDMPPTDVLAETGNIVAARLADVIGQMTSLEGRPLPPATGLALRSALIEAVLALTAQDEPLVFARSILTIGDDVTAELLFFPAANTVAALESLA